MEIILILNFSNVPEKKHLPSHSYSCTTPSWAQGSFLVPALGQQGHDMAAQHPLNQGVSQLANSLTTVDSERVTTASVVTGSWLYSCLSSYCFERTVAILLYVELACG